MKSKHGFTLIEILIAIGVFSVVIVFFITMFLAITRVQVRQSSLAEVNGQSQFLLQEMQYYIGQASLVDIPADVATTTLKLRMPLLAQDPTYITVSSGTVYLQQAGGAAQALSSNKVSVSNVTFIRHANAPGHDSVSIAFSLAYNTSNVQQLFSEMFQTSVARVSAATFDSDVVPSSTATYSLGAAGNIWSSINGKIYFSGNNVGVGVVSPAFPLDVNGTVNATQYCINGGNCFTSSGGGGIGFPDGVGGTPVNFNAGLGYTVPAGQTLYITAISNVGALDTTLSVGNASFYLVAQTTFTLPGPIVAASGTSVSGVTVSVSGFTIAAGVTAINSNAGYTVPAGKTLYITALGNTAAGSGSLTAAGVQFFVPAQTTISFPGPIVAGAGSSVTLAGGATFSGYVK